MRPALLLLLSLTFVPAARADDNLDRFCHQKDCGWSNLYWYTDLAEAKRVAQRENKPILSLRLLGNLDEELSCANSRFFRTFLYANRDISAYLRANFVLHWKSERPVPKVTIDFGDGRKMVRTITGNSIHYILAPDGRVVDALPGLYDPQTFLAELQRVNIASVPAPEPPTFFQPKKAPTAINAQRLSMSKGGVEIPMLRRIWEMEAASPDGYMVYDDATSARAQKIVFDAHSLQLMRKKTAVKSDAAFDAMMTRLKLTVASDTEFNQTKMRPMILRWIADGMTDLETLNRRVYDEAFLTPRSDEWLGLRNDTIYSGIEGDGITTSEAAPADTSARLLSRAPAGSARSRR